MELRKRRKVYELWKKRQITQEGHKDVMRLFREKISRPNPNLNIIWLLP